MGKKDIIGYDFQGWPIYKRTLRDILIKLGAKEHNGGIIGFEVGNPMLDVYPTTLEDDGMGYGINEMYIMDVDYDPKNGTLHIWREIEDTEINKEKE